MKEEIFKCESNNLQHTFTTSWSNNRFNIANYRSGIAVAKIVFCGFCQKAAFCLFGASQFFAKSADWIGDEAKFKLTLLRVFRFWEVRLNDIYLIGENILWKFFY